MHKENPKGWVKSLLSLCMTAISVAGLGISALDIHAKEKKTIKESAYIIPELKKKEKELALVSEPVTQSLIASFITKEGTVKTGLGGCLSLCYQIIHLFHGPQKQNRLQLCLFTVPLPNNFHWEKPNVPITWRIEWLRTLKTVFAESQKGFTLRFLFW